MAGFLGMRGTGDWVTDQRPKDWRETILYLWPNGMAPLTAIMSKMKSESTTDPEFNWWIKTHDTQGAAITGVFTNTSLTTTYASIFVPPAGAAAGVTVYVRMSLADVRRYRKGHQVTLRVADFPLTDVIGKVTDRNENGASSYLSVRLLEADDNGAAYATPPGQTNLGTADRVVVSGNINAEGAAMPQALTRDPTKIRNFTQIFRSPLSITRTAMKTKLRTGDDYKEAKREALEYHSVELEKAFIWGIPTEGVGDNGKPERTTGGIRDGIRSAIPTNELDFRYDPAFSSNTWLGGGYNFFTSALERVFRYGSMERLGLGGSGALLALQRLAEVVGEIKLEPKQVDFGIKVTQWITPFGTLNFMTHPLFTQEPSMINDLLILDPKNLNYRYIDDTMFKSDKSDKEGGQLGIDGKNEEYLTECGLELHFPETFMLIHGIGEANVV